MSARSGTLALLRVLVVDDSPVMRRLIVRAFELADIALAEVHEAADGLAALERLRNHEVDLLLCDLNMPNMGGLDLLRAMHEDGLSERIPVIVVSSNRGDGLNTETRALGVRAYVHKPFRPEAFGRLVREVLALGERT